MLPIGSRMLFHGNTYRRSMAYTHGTNYGYLKRRCRCDACRAWNAAYHRGYRQRRKARTGERIKNGRFIRVDD